MNIKIKKFHKDAVIPKYAKDGDAGMDLVAITEKWNLAKTMVTYDTGIGFEIPKGHVGLVFPRSSISKTSLILSNAVGVIDSGYRGSVTLKYRYPEEGMVYDVGDRIGQLIIIPIPEIKFEEVEELSDTERGTGGYGSTGT